MSHRFLASITGLAAIVLVTGLSVKTSAQSRTDRKTSWTVQRTSWGDPDIEGFWTNTTTTPLQRPAELGDKTELTPEEYAKRNAEVAARQNVDQAPLRKGDPGNYNDFWYERGVLNYRTSLVVDPSDGRLPPLTPEGQRLVDARRTRPAADSPEERSVYERCITRGLPGAMLPGFYNHNYQIVQTPGYVVLSVEMIHDARIIPTDGRAHTSSAIRNWLGDSRGHWEGNTLVVETTNFNDKVREQSLIAFSTGKNLALVERFTRTGPNTIDYQFTVNDPTVYTRPWTASIPMVKFSGPIYEYACHEGNYALGGILRGARMDEKAAK